MKKQFLPLMLLASAICSCSEKQSETTEPMITKTEIQVENGLLTPEIMHRLGKVVMCKYLPTTPRFFTEYPTPASNRTRATANSSS